VPANCAEASSLSVPVLPDANVTAAVDAPNNSSSVPPLTVKLPPLVPEAGPGAVLIPTPRLTPAPARFAVLGLFASHTLKLLDGLARRHGSRPAERPRREGRGAIFRAASRVTPAAKPPPDRRPFAFRAAVLGLTLPALSTEGA
jgi:hypothetical protein